MKELTEKFKAKERICYLQRDKRRGYQEVSCEAATDVLQDAVEILEEVPGSE